MGRKKIDIDKVSYQDGLTQLSNKLINSSGNDKTFEDYDLKLDNFFEFVRDVWSQGYSNPEHFSLWHVKLLCEELQTTIENDKHYVAIIPRGHYKSTVLGHAFSIWRLLKLNKETKLVYLSYSEEMAEYHLSEIKKYIRNNPILSNVLIDRYPNSDFAFRYYYGINRLEIIPAGVFSFKRGTHVDGGLIADDLLRDPDNPLVHTQLAKVEETFFREAMYIPNPGVPIVVMGTPMAPNDLLSKLQDDERFNNRVLPVFNPVPNVKVLAPEIRDEKWLLRESKERPNSFATEFMLTPFLSSISYLNDAEIKEIENESLPSFDIYIQHYDTIDSDYTVAGLDIGKKRSPSHLVIFRSKEVEFKIIQINSTFLDGWDYTKQAEFINEVTRNFEIDRGYFDNTRAELEDRSLDTSVWTPIIFSPRIKKRMAQIFERFVKNKYLELLMDLRQRSQITCVDNDLNAPVTPLGHGDSFWAIAMAAVAYNDMHTKGIYDIGNIGNFARISEDALVQKMSTIAGVIEGFCPDCGEKVGWVPERKLCFICYGEKEKEEFNEMLMKNRNVRIKNLPSII